MSPGLLTSDDDFWSRQRRLSNPAFHRESIIRYAQITAEEAARLTDGWKSKEVRDIHRDMMNVTLRIVLRSLFGGELGDSMPVVEQALNTVMRSSSGINVIAAFFHIPTPAKALYLRAVRELDRAVYELIRRGRAKLRCGADADADGPQDLLTLLLMAQDEDGSSMTDQQLRDEVVTLLVAGHETTALSLTWVWYLLAQNSDIEEKLLAELDAVLGGRAPSANDLSGLVHVPGSPSGRSGSSACHTYGNARSEIRDAGPRRGRDWPRADRVDLAMPIRKCAWERPPF